MNIPRCLSALLLLVASGAMAEQFFKWKDAEGVWHYTNTPPPAGTDHTAVNVTGGTPSAAPVVSQPQVAAAPGAPGTEGKPPAEPTDLRGKRELACQKAKAQVAALETNAIVRMDMDGDGTPETLSDAQHASELERMRALSQVYCKVD